MEKFIFLLFALLEINLVEGQGLNADSLKNLLVNAQEDTTKVMLISRLSDQLDRSNPDSGIQLAQQGLKLAQKIDFKRGELYCKKSLAVGLWSIGDYPTAIKLFLSNVKYVDATNDLELQITFYAGLESAYRDEGDYAEALKYLSVVMNLIQRDARCKLCRAGFTGYADLFLEKHQLDSAQVYMQKAFLYPPAKGTDGWIYSTAGRIQSELKNYEGALNFYRLSVHAQLEEINLKDLANTYSYMANLFKKTGLKDSALSYAYKALAISQPKRFAKEILETSLLLSSLYESFNTDSALHYYKQSTIAQDSLYNLEKQRQIMSYRFNDELRQNEIKATEQQYKNRNKLFVLSGLLVFFLVLLFVMFRNNRQKQKANIKIEKAYEKLKSTQAQLIQSEKMASLGELTAGIAHEIQNPLNFVNNFSEVNMELIEELKTELKAGNYEDAITTANDIDENEQKIIHHGKRADAIVKGMLMHSRAGTGQKEPTDINALADEYLRLAYHGLRAKDKSFNAKMKTDYDEKIGNINIVPQDIGRVILNLITNAFYSVSEKKSAYAKAPADKHHPDNYEPTVSVSTKRLTDNIEIKVKDNGMGIPQRVMDKIFQPFFTTKPTGQGTGLGLSLSYDIVTKGHGGELKVQTKEGEGAEFMIILPLV